MDLTNFLPFLTGGLQNMDETKTRMTQGPIWKILLRFALPLLLGNLFQQLYNAVDAFVVGNFDSKAALAAVTSSGSLCFLVIGFFQGVFVGASVIISRYYGAQDSDGVDRAVHTTVIFSLLLGSVLSIFGVLFTPTILGWMGTPENVMPNSVAYFRIYCAGLLGLVLYNTANGIFQALGDSRHPLYYLISASLINIALDLLFVAGFHMGVSGAALATVIGQVLSALLGFARLMSGKCPVRFSFQKLRLDKAIFARIFRLGLPSGVQNSVISIANVVIQSNINAFGDNAMAGCGSYFKIEGFVFLPITSLALALTTFVSQNLGAGNPERAKQGTKLGIAMSMSLAEFTGLLFFLFAPFLIGLFNHEPEVVAYGVRQVQVECFFYCFLALSHTAAAALRGAGRAVIPMAIMLAVWCVGRITYVTLMVARIPDISVVFSAYPVTWSTSALLFVIYLWKVPWLKTTPTLANS